MKEVLKSFISIAESDINSALMLYKKGNYANSLFMLQQSVEKAYKVAGVLTHQLLPNDVKKIGHDYLNLLRISLNKSNPELTDLSLTTAVDFGIFDADVDSHAITTTMNTIKRANLFNTSESEIEEYFKGISKYKRMNKTLYHTLKGRKKIIEMSKAKFPFTPEHFESFERETLDLTNSMTDVENLLNHTFTVGMLGMITSPHSEQARYPFFDSTTFEYTCPIATYNINLPIIKHQKKMMKMAAGSIQYFKAYLESAM